MDGNPSEISLSEQLRASAFNEVSSTHKNLAKTDPIEFIKLCHKKFCEKKIAAFPYMCEVARVQNFMKWKELNEVGRKGKYTDSMGWSEDGTFKFEYEIPTELHNFMTNLVYDKFWDEDNRPIWRKFMKRVCDGDDPNRLLIWVRSQYGTEQGKVTAYGM